MIEIGAFCEETFQFTQADVVKFSKVSGDDNPIHLDEEYAKSTIFKKPIVHGFLAGSIFSKIIGTRFPGEGTIYLSQDMKFKRPVHVGQEYSARVEVLELDQEKHRAILSTIVSDSEGNEVILGSALVQNKTRL